MNIPNVCRTCRYFLKGECTNDLYELTDENGYDSGIYDVINALDMGEILTILEELLPGDKLSRPDDSEALRVEIDEAICKKIYDTIDNAKKPIIRVKDPDSFGCNQWR